mmetsp:Transcript_14469/g.23947  ORF Transcript_14469/g.23947 Transcript_14469/m.23947 type:complete len:548 (+) Transcript_14469:50-1693(+)
MSTRSLRDNEGANKAAATQSNRMQEEDGTLCCSAIVRQRTSGPINEVEEQGLAAPPEVWLARALAMENEEDIAPDTMTVELQDGSELTIQLGDRLRWASYSGKKSIVSTDSTTISIMSDDISNDIIASFLRSRLKEPSPPTVSDVVHQWATEASIHGVPFVLHIHIKAWRRMVWACISLTALGVMIFHMHQLVVAYRQYNLNSNVEIASPPTLPFPEVTICNVGTIQISKVLDTQIVEPSNEEELIKISQSRADFIRVSSFDHKELELAENWKPIITHNGLCWRFNTNNRITLPGDDTYDGLRVLLYVNSEEYAPGMNGVVPSGIHVFVAQPNTTATSQMSIGFVRPGEVTFMALERTMIQRETQKPWSKCKGEAPYYTQQMCRENCLFENHRQEYGCRKTGDPIPDLNYCGANATTRIAVDGTSYDDRVRECVNQNCSIPTCYEESYSTTVSSLSLDGRNASEADLIENEMIILRINYASMKETRVTETKAVTASQLFGNIGGLMGLYLGISSLSVIEILGELFLLRLLPRMFGNRRLYGVGSKET